LEDHGDNTPLDCANDRIYEIFDQELSQEIMKALKNYGVSWLSLDMLPLFTLAPLKDAILRVGLDNRADEVENFSAMEESVRGLVKSTSLRDLVKPLFSQVNISLGSSEPVVGIRSGVVTGVGSTGTIGGVLGRESPTGPYIALTCCHVISKTPQEIGSDNQPQKTAVSLVSGDGESRQAQCFDRSVRFPSGSRSEIVDWALVEFQHSGGFQGNVCVQSPVNSIS
jgi:hypothetical protein